MELNKNILFIGAGNMARAIIKGALESKLTAAENIFCNDIDELKLSALKDEFGVSGAKDKKSVQGADIVVLSCKPQQMEEVLNEIKDYLDDKKITVSIAAGVTTGYIEKILGNKKVIRVMPNTPAGVLAGATALCKGRFAGDEDLTTVEKIFSAVGITKILGEDKLDAITALSGSGPAYVFYLCELMQRAGQELGLDKETAKEFAAQTVFGAGKMLAGKDSDAATLKKNVTSPGGTTQAALEYFKTQDLSDIVLEAMKRASNRSKELSK